MKCDTTPPSLPAEKSDFLVQLSGFPLKLRPLLCFRGFGVR